MTSWLLAEDWDTNDSVVREEEPVEDGGEGKLGGDIVDGHLVAPAKLVSTQEGEH